MTLPTKWVVGKVENTSGDAGTNIFILCIWKIFSLAEVFFPLQLCSPTPFLIYFGNIISVKFCTNILPKPPSLWKMIFCLCFCLFIFIKSQECSFPKTKHYRPKEHFVEMGNTSSWDWRDKTHINFQEFLTFYET